MRWLNSRKYDVQVITKAADGTDRYGNPKLVDQPPILVKNVIVSRAATSAFSRRELEKEAEGHQPFSRWKLILPGKEPWPGGVHSRIIWEGSEYDQYGEAAQNVTGINTAHSVVYMQSRTAEVK